MWLLTFPPSGYLPALRRKARWSYVETQMFVNEFAKARSLCFIPVAWKLGWDNQLTGQMSKYMVQKALRELMNPTGNVERFLSWVWVKRLQHLVGLSGRQGKTQQLTGWTGGERRVST